MIEIDLFWCCLPPDTKTAWELCGLNYLINPVFIERTFVDAIFSFGGTAESLKRLSLFTWTAGLLPGTIVVEEVEIEVYFYLSPGVPDYAAFWLAGEFDCECRCEIQRFPEPC
jgi:hypothetical protein